MDRKKWIIYGVLTALLTAALLVYTSQRESIYRMLTPKVTGVSLGPGWLNGQKYELVVQNKYIHRDDEDRFHVYLIRKRENFWYSVHYIERAYVRVVAADDKTSAIESTGDITFQSGVLLLAQYARLPSDGEEVYVAD